jgi:hypothetical protein
MKKILALILASMMLFSFVACNNGNEENTTDVNTNETTGEKNEITTEAPAEDVKSAEEMLNATLDAFYAQVAPLFGSEDYAPTVEEVMAYYSGGYYSESEDTFVSGASKNIPLDDEMAIGALMSGTLISAENIEKIDDAALFFFMNANNFTTFVYHVKNEGDIATIAGDFESAVTNNMWMCGFPELYYAIQVGDFVFAGFGLESQITAIKSVITSTYENATLICEGVIR